MKKTAQCGSYSGNAAHYRRGEKPCEDCRVAAREYQKQRYAASQPPPQTAPCAICGVEFTGKRKGTKYCGKRCQNVATMRSDAFKRAMAKRNSQGRPKVERICAHCGNPWMVDKSGSARHCSVKCGKASARRCRDLVHVGPAEFSWLPRGHMVIKLIACIERRPTPAARQWKLFVSGPCSWCGEDFTAWSTAGTERYCGRKCADKARSANGRKFWVPARVRVAIYERDEWTCQLCLEPVDPDLMTTNPFGDWSPSLDHIVPQSKGGTHNPDNLRLAHRWCNCIRGDETYYTAADLRVA